MAGASLYIACRFCGYAITLDEIAGASGLPKKDIGRAYRHLVRELGINPPPFTAKHFAVRLLARFRLRGQTEDMALRLLDKLAEARAAEGCSPVGVAAAAVYAASLAFSERLTQREIAEKAGVTEVTVRNHFKRIMRSLEITLYL